MKTLNKWLLALLVCSTAASPLRAQRLVSDMKIVYKLELPPDQQQAGAMPEGSTLTQYMRGHLSRIDMSMGVVHYTYLINSKEQILITLIDNHGDKYLIRSDKEEYEKELKQYSNIRFKMRQVLRNYWDTPVKRLPALCLMATPLKCTIPLTWYRKINITTRRFVNLKGMPLQFEIITRAGTRMNVVATHIDLHPIPAAMFETPTSGYKVMSKEELQKMGN